MMQHRVRAIEAQRLSKVTGPKSTAIGIQRRSKDVAKYAAAYNLDIVGVATDLDTSGSSDPFARKDLGAWLARPDDFDVIIATDLDRLARSARHLTALRDWCDANGKRLIVVNDHLEWPAPKGQDLVWDILGRLAQWELESITERNRGTRQWLQSTGKLAVKAPYGYRVTGERNSKTLEVHPVTGPIVREAADRYLAGESLDEIADDFQARGLPSRNQPRKNDTPHWYGNTVGRYLKDDAIKGILHQGDYTMKIPFIVTVAEHKAIIARLAERTYHHGVRVNNREMLVSVLRCGYCEKGMQLVVQHGRNGQTWRYYYCGNARCPEKPRMMIPLMSANFTAMQAVVKLTKDTPVTRTEIIPGHDYEDEISREKEMLAALDPELDDWDQRVVEHRAEIARLRSLPIQPPRHVEVPTGEYVADLFADMNAAQRRGLLMRSGIEFTVTKGADRDHWSVTMTHDGNELSGTLTIPREVI